MFKKYIHDFLSIVTSDDDFDRHELVALVRSAAQSSGYLRRSSAAIHGAARKGDEGRKSDPDPELRSRVADFSEVFSAAALEADDEVEAILEKFCAAQKVGPIR